MATTRIPRKLSLFDLYIKGVINMLLTPFGSSTPPVLNWQRLGLTLTDIAVIQTFFGEWWTGIPATPGAYELHTNAYGITKTEDTRKQVLDIIKRFSDFFSPLLTRMDGSPNITSAIRQVLNIADPNPPHVRHTAEITDSCYTKVVSTQGEKVKLKCSPEADSKRSSILKGEGAIEIEVLISVLPSTIDNTGKIIPPLAPAGHKDPTLTINETSTKAAFFLKTLPDGCATKILQGYARWRDVHNMERSGPWTPIPPTIIN